jgi:DNA mismatch repair ATPase MutL
MEIEPLQSLARRARSESKRAKTASSAEKSKTKSATEKKRTSKKTTTKESTATKSTAKKTTAKKTAGKKTADKKDSSKSSTTKRTSTTGSSGLLADLKKNNDESYDRADLLDGIRLAVQLAGVDVIQQTVLALVTDWVPGMGESAEKKAVDLIVKATKEEYPKCSAGEKKGLRAVIHWIRNDFDLRASLSPSELMSGLMGG